MDWIPTPALLRRQCTDLRYFHERLPRCSTWRSLAECHRGERHIDAAERNEPGTEPEVQSSRLVFEPYLRTRVPSSVAPPATEDDYILIPVAEEEQYNQWIRFHTNLSWAGPPGRRPLFGSELIKDSWR
jgi:hypothetical protein